MIVRTPAHLLSPLFSMMRQTSTSNMTRFPKEMTENDIHYTLHVDYFFPDLVFPESPRQAIGRYVRMRKAYLEEHHPGLYTRLILSGKLFDYLAETDQVCRDRMERIINRIAEAEGVNEQLKASDQLGWVSRINSIHQRAEEIILDELVFA